MSSQSLNYIIDIMQSTTKTIDAFLDMLRTLFKEHEHNKSVKSVLDHLEKYGQEGMNFTNCEDVCVKTFIHELENKNVPYVQLMDNKTGMPVIVTRNTDIDKVQEAKQATLAREKKINEVSIDQLMKPIAKNKYKKLTKIPNVTYAQIEYMRDDLAKNKVLFSKKYNKETNTYDLFFEEDNKAMAAKSYLAAKIALTCELGDYIYDNIETEKRINDAIVDTVGNCFKKENLVIVSAKNPNEKVVIEDTYFKHTLQTDEREIVKRQFYGSREDAQKGAYWATKAMMDPVIMPLGEYNKLLELSDAKLRSELLLRRQEQKQKYGSKQMTDFEKECAEKERLAKQLIEMKLIIDEAPIGAYPANPYDGNCSFYEFIRQNTKNMETDERKEKQEKMEEMAEKLDTAPEKVKEKVFSYLASQKEILKNADIESIFEEYEPTTADKHNNIDQFIENMQYEVAPGSKEHDEQER